MIYPIVAYGDPVLKKVAEDIPEGDKDVKELIENMFETMYAASGVGLAAPQIGKSVRLFIVDASPFAEDYEEDDSEEGKEAFKQLSKFKKAFINPIIIEESGSKWGFEEGCLSIPDIRSEVMRKPKITIEYYDEDWNLKEETYDGLVARVIQHEYDHIEGVLFTDLLNPLRKRMLSKKLSNITKGNVRVNYKMKFPKR